MLSAVAIKGFFLGHETKTDWPGRGATGNGRAGRRSVVAGQSQCTCLGSRAVSVGIGVDGRGAVGERG